MQISNTDLSRWDSDVPQTVQDAAWRIVEHHCGPELHAVYDAGPVQGTNIRIDQWFHDRFGEAKLDVLPSNLIPPWEHFVGSCLPETGWVPPPKGDAITYRAGLIRRIRRYEAILIFLSDRQRVDRYITESGATSADLRTILNWLPECLAPKLEKARQELQNAAPFLDQVEKALQKQPRNKDATSTGLIEAASESGRQPDAASQEWIPANKAITLASKLGRKLTPVDIDRLFKKPQRPFGIRQKPGGLPGRHRKEVHKSSFIDYLPNLPELAKDQRDLIHDTSEELPTALRQEIRTYLKHAGPLRTRAIAGGLRKSEAEIEEALEGDPRVRKNRDGDWVLGQQGN
jgi:hypothetical protein